MINDNFRVSWCWFLYSLPQWWSCNLCDSWTGAPCSHSVFDMFTLCSVVSPSCKEWVFFLGFCCCHGSDDNAASWVQLYANEFPRQPLYGPTLPVQWAQLMRRARHKARLYKHWEEDCLRLFKKKGRDIRVKLAFKRTADRNWQRGVTLCQWRSERSEHHESPQRLSKGAQTKEPTYNPSNLTEQLM